MNWTRGIISFSCSVSVAATVLGGAQTKFSEKRGTFDGTGHIVTEGNISGSKYVKGTSIEGSYALLPTRPLKLAGSVSY